MAKSKYTEETVQAICDAIALHGLDRYGWEAGQISEPTFYDWKKRYSEFSESIAQAKKEWYEAQSEGARRQAYKALSDYLHGRAVERWDCYDDTLDRDGNIVTLHKSRTVQRGVPQWVIDRYLGPPIHEIEALKVLVNAGWFPSWVIQLSVDEISKCRKAIREAVVGLLPERGGSTRSLGLSNETAAAIRAKILGVDASGTAAVSGEVGERSRSGEADRKIPTNRD